MPIDNALISESKNYAATQLTQAIPTACPDLYFLESFINPKFANKLIEVVSTDKDLPWEIEPQQQYKNRVKLGWIFDTVFEEAHEIFDSLTPALNEKFNRTNRLLRSEEHTSELQSH